MTVENNNILFRYLLEDAWGVLISEITLLSDCEENNVIGLNRNSYGMIGMSMTMAGG